MTAETRAMLGRRQAPRSCVFVEVARVDGPEVRQRAPGITPGPVIQFGSFNVNAIENEDGLESWYARCRLPLMAGIAGCVGARKLVSISGWAKHGILYSPHSPSLGQRIWPA